MRDLQVELRRLLELHGVETAPQKQQLLAEPVFPVTMQQHVRTQYQDYASQLPPQQAPPGMSLASRTYTPAGVVPSKNASAMSPTHPTQLTIFQQVLNWRLTRSLGHRPLLQAQSQVTSDELLMKHTCKLSTHSKHLHA